MTTVMVDASRVDLVQRWADQGYRNGAEIGVWAGVFSQQICQGLPRVRLRCVDPWCVYPGYDQDPKNNPAKMEKAYQSACRRLAPYPVTFDRQPSVESSRLVPDGSLDFVYIDGNHAEPYITQDLEAWTPKVRSGGMVCGHDYVRKVDRPDMCVADAVDRFLANRDVTLSVYTHDKFPSFAWMVP